ncbi:MAG: response regulator transcription factor [Rectinemataceae bacterium]|jgi:CheY-like chemotaxis protein
METRKRILLVDDEQINLEFFDVMLSKLGFEVRKADNGIDALEVIRHWKPNLIMLDNVMPRLSGWEVTKILKTKEEYREYADIPIIMFSAMDDVKDKVEGLELGADDYITKPFNFSEVLARIRAILRTHDLVAQIERREERMRVTEDLSESLLTFIADLRPSIASFGSDAETALRGRGDPAAVASSVAAGTKELLAKLDALGATVASLKDEATRLKDQETEIHAIKRGLRA